MRFADCAWFAKLCLMKSAAILALVLSATICGSADPLSSADREALLERLDKLREEADSKVDARFRMAITAFRAAAESNDAAVDFYLKCVEKVDFEDQMRKASDFREWKRREADKLAGSGPALRLQLHWLILTLRACSEKTEKSELASGAREILDSIFRDADKLADHRQILNQPVNSTVFARAYGVDNLEAKDWPMAPAQLGAIYDQILLPPLRNPARIAELQAAWQKRIQQELTREEFWANRNANAAKKIGTVDALRPPEYERFIAETVPELQWQMELDLFRSGDESGAALRMLAHLEKHVNHASSREWTETFRGLLTPKETADANPAG
jgi:hypothetical protein